MNRDASVTLVAEIDQYVRNLQRAGTVTGNFAQSATAAGTRAATGMEQGTARVRNALGQYVNASNRAGQQVAQSQNGANRSLNQTASIYSQLKGLAVKTFAVDQVLNFGNAIVTTTGKFEKYQSVLTNALGSRSGAKSAQSLITDFAAATPNSVSEITEDFVKLVNRGITPTKQQLTNLGDLAASQGKGFDQLTEAVLDAQTGEFERLKEFGIRASKSGDQATLSFKGVTQTVKATSGEITNAILKFGQMSGVQGSMAAVSLTLEGQISNLGDSFDRLLVVLGNAGIAGGFKIALGAAQQLLGVMTDLIATSPADTFRKEQTEINGLVGAIALANDNESVRLSLINQLNQQYPEFLGKLGAESATNDILAGRLSAVNAQYEKKIRIAQAEDEIKKKTEEVNRAIEQQTTALKALVSQSGKTLPELQNMKPADQVALAKQVGDRNKLTKFRPSYFGVSAGNSTDYLASTLQSGMAAQATAQKELNTLLGENAIRQGDLTKVTVGGYQAQIKAIQDKIKLHQIDKKVGGEEIARLRDQIRIAEGKPAKVDKTPIGAGSGSKAIPKSTWTVLEVLNRAVKSINEDIETKRSLHIDVPAETFHLLSNTEAQIKRIKGETDKISTLKPVGVSLISLNLQGEAERMANFTEGFKARAAEIKKYGSLDFYYDLLEKIRTEAAKISLQNLKLDSKDVAALKDAATHIGKANAATKRADKIRNDAETLGEMEEDPSRVNMGKVGNIFSSAGVTADAVKGMMKQFGAAKDAVNMSVAEIANAMDSGRQQLRDAAVGLLSSIGESIGKGEDPLKAGLKVILDALSGFIIQLGTALLFSSAALLAAAPLTFGITLAPGISQQLAGAGLIVAGAALKGFAGSFEKGGLFKGESLIRVGESNKALKGGGEWVSPIGEGAKLMTQEMSRLGAFGGPSTSTERSNSPTPNEMSVRISLGEAKVRGSDLYFALERHKRSIGKFGNG